VHDCLLFYFSNELKNDKSVHHTDTTGRLDERYECGSSLRWPPSRGDSLADSPQLARHPAFNTGRRWLCATNQKRAGQWYSPGLAEGPPFRRINVGGDVGRVRHA